MNKTRPLLSVILPTFNEIENVQEMYRQLKEVIDPLDLDYEFIFVDDNSPDNTIGEIKNLQRADKKVKYLLMSRRYGDQLSLMAGLDYSSGDIVITMDSDLQHPPRYIPEMIEKWRENSNIVIMTREKAGHSNVFKSWAEILFYKLIEKLSRTPIYYRFSGYALIDRKAVNALTSHQEKEPFVRGLIGLVGFNVSEKLYREDERILGKSKYYLTDMIKLALSGIVSFSTMPLHLSFFLGLFSVLIGAVYSVYAILSNIFYYNDIEGWTSTIIFIAFMGGAQLISTGVLGLYISKIFIESKGRPRYIVSETKGFTNE